MKLIEKRYATKIDLFGLTTLIFLTLKLCKVIAWSWWWIFAPLWVPVALLLLTGIMIFIVSSLKEKKKAG